MFIAGEASGDQLAAELVSTLREHPTGQSARPTDEAQPRRASLEPRCFGAGGPRMAEAGVELVRDLTRHSVIGLWEVIRNYGKFRRFFRELLRVAIERQPDAIICVDYSGFNRRFAAAVKRRVRSHQSWFHNWDPKIVQYVSPQVWASREDRAYQLERDMDLLLSIFPFEKEWYARRTPKLRVEFVGHPIFDRHPGGSEVAIDPPPPPLVLLLPGSRREELRRHLPVMVGAARLVAAKTPCQFWAVLPDAELAAEAAALARLQMVPALAAPEYHPEQPPAIRCSYGNLPAALRQATVAIASTGTVTVECAFFGVPTVALYKTSWSTYQIGRRIVHVPFLAMPNLLAGEEVFPEFIQQAATPENVARAALELLTDEARRLKIKAQLARIIASLGGPGARRRAAKAITELLQAPPGERPAGFDRAQEPSGAGASPQPNSG